MSTLTVIRFALVSILLFGLACKETPQGQASDCADRRVRIGVASSLREIALSLRHEFSARSDPFDAEMIFGASSVHARQLRLGAPMDILVSADADIVESLVRRGMLLRDSVFEIARGRLVLMTTEDWPIGLGSVAALDSTQLQRIAIPSEAVPLGRYVRRWLDGQGRLDNLAGRIVTTEHARATLAAVDAGHVDLAVVYESDARFAKRATMLETIDPALYPSIRYVAARATAASNCPFVDEALEAWRSPAVMEQFERHGFLPALSTEDS